MLRWIKEHKIFTAAVSIVIILAVIISVSYFRGNGFFGKAALFFCGIRLLFVGHSNQIIQTDMIKAC